MKNFSKTLKVTHNPSKMEIVLSDSFWDYWIKNRFNLSILKRVQGHSLRADISGLIKISDGRTFVEGRRESVDTTVVYKGYKTNKIYTKDEVESRGFTYVRHSNIFLGLPKSLHFMHRYKERNFSLKALPNLIAEIAQAKLGQRIEVKTEDTILIGIRTHEKGSVLITGMTRGEIDWDDYVDKKI